MNKVHLRITNIACALLLGVGVAQAQTWDLGGNDIGSGDFIGTKSTSTVKDVVIKTDGLERVHIMADPNSTEGAAAVGIGTPTPDANLAVVAGCGTSTLISATYWPSVLCGGDQGDYFTARKFAGATFDGILWKTAFTIKANGNTGIGLANPPANLTVKNARCESCDLWENKAFAILNENENPIVSAFNFGDGSNEGVGMALLANPTKPVFWILNDASGSTPTLFGVRGNGTVGLGANNPIAQLDVSSTEIAGINYLFTARRGAQHFLSVDNDGNVGIGTGLPQDKLEVNGSQIISHGGNLTLKEVGGPYPGSINFAVIGTSSDVAIAQIKTQQMPLMPMHELVFNIGDNTDGDMVISRDNNGSRVGIGTNIPKEALQIGDRWAFYNGSDKAINYNATWDGTNNVRIADGAYSGMVFTNTGDIQFRTAATGSAGSSVGNDIHLIIANNGKVGISRGNTADMAMPGNYALYVHEGIMTEKVKVAVSTTADWSDFVFDSNYKLPTFKELDEYINLNKHLPGVPAADEVVCSGVDVGKMDATLLQKIEELTLYVLELKKENEKQQYLIEQLKHN